MNEKQNQQLFEIVNNAIKNAALALTIDTGNVGSEFVNVTLTFKLKK